MKSRQRTKYIHEGWFIAEVDADLLEDESGWSPYLTVEDACRLDNVREALRKGDVSVASKLARVFTMEPVSTPS
ncbi:MAG: hypothetical protein EXR28_15065 [Betaproteobacteria bacterium]|nr:hypothetical protein [Betaproteobacteria bacterium]